MHEDAQLERADDNTLMIHRNGRNVRFSMTATVIPLAIDIDPVPVWHPFPGLRCWNVYAKVELPEWASGSNRIYVALLVSS